MAVGRDVGQDGLSSRSDLADPFRNMDRFLVPHSSVHGNHARRLDVSSQTRSDQHRGAIQLKLHSREPVYHEPEAFPGCATSPNHHSVWRSGCCSEADLKLYRLSDDQTTWAEATCAGQELLCYPEDNTVVVPICQTGSFVLSDEMPSSDFGTYTPVVLRNS